MLLSFLPYNKDNNNKGLPLTSRNKILSSIRDRRTKKQGNKGTATVRDVKQSWGIAYTCRYTSGHLIHDSVYIQYKK